VTNTVSATVPTSPACRSATRRRRSARPRPPTSAAPPWSPRTAAPRARRRSRSRRTPATRSPRRRRWAGRGRPALRGQVDRRPPDQRRGRVGRGRELRGDRPDRADGGRQRGHAVQARLRDQVQLDDRRPGQLLARLTFTLTAP
jgi:hypothetical protein